MLYVFGFVMILLFFVPIRLTAQSNSSARPETIQDDFKGPQTAIQHVSFHIK